MIPKLFFLDLEVYNVPKQSGDLLHSIKQVAVSDPSRPEGQRYFMAYVLPHKLLNIYPQQEDGIKRYKFKRVLEDLTHWVNSSLDGNRQAIFVGHNIYQHDWKILDNECTRIHQAIPKHWRPFDTLYLAGMLYGNGGNSQIELCHRLGVELLPAHDALNDVKMLEGVWKAMVGTAKIDKILKAALLPPKDHPVVKVAAIIRKVAEPILVFYDFETTGLFPDNKNPNRPNPRVVEIGAHIPSLNESWGTFVNPGIPIPQEAINIHGITDEMVRNQPTFKAAWLSFEDWINTKIGNTTNKIVILCGHNIWGYDNKVYKAECERTNLPIKAWKSLDTLAVARVMCKGIKMEHKLQTWRERLGIGENQAHRAIGDVMVNAQVFARWTQGILLKNLNKAILSDHPAKSIGQLISDKGSFNPHQYVRGKKEKEEIVTNAYGKREREEEKEPAPEVLKYIKEEPAEEKGEELELVFDANMDILQ